MSLRCGEPGSFPSREESAAFWDGLDRIHWSRPGSCECVLPLCAAETVILVEFPTASLTYRRADPSNASVSPRYQGVSGRVSHGCRFSTFRFRGGPNNVSNRHRPPWQSLHCVPSPSRTRDPVSLTYPLGRDAASGLPRTGDLTRWRWSEKPNLRFMRTAWPGKPA